MFQVIIEASEEFGGVRILTYLDELNANLRTFRSEAV